VSMFTVNSQRLSNDIKSCTISWYNKFLAYKVITYLFIENIKLTKKRIHDKDIMVYGRKYKGLGYLRKVSTQLNWKVDST
jgi:hypothetical protein